MTVACSGKRKDQDHPDQAKSSSRSLFSARNKCRSQSVVRPCPPINLATLSVPDSKQEVVRPEGLEFNGNSFPVNDNRLPKQAEHGASLVCTVHDLSVLSTSLNYLCRLGGMQ